jgi:hypothetical protein
MYKYASELRADELGNSCTITFLIHEYTQYTTGFTFCFVVVGVIESL